MLTNTATFGNSNDHFHKGPNQFRSSLHEKDSLQMRNSLNAFSNSRDDSIDETRKGGGIADFFSRRVNSNYYDSSLKFFQF